ncbi:MAG TPA: prolipoprotein diacylglyceryl transferase [Propionibacteriaceae bacterium]|nr:prolipoprotein diacylglyceryl transferase [Propionibacteriaceae bacterium]HPZ50557.1 prolipoprotein diacylglyceryl transferase [Propionibacteriaceae bacterium]HQE30970.1 prolipoprotein diacylglyceryl transferase [Propionibacteriaceae bacterium]
MTLASSLLSIPSPSQGTWWIGPIPIRAYALCILLGIVVAWWLTMKRWVAKGGRTETLEGILTWAILAGIIGARIYHVITDYQLYFGEGRDWWRMFFIWEGGLGIWGAVALGGLAAWWQARKHGVAFSAIADSVAPGLLLAQAIGRLGNWFNQELYGRPTTLPWGLEIDPAHRIAGYENAATYHPTFLYELLWNVAACAVLLWAEKRWSLSRGKVFALYVVMYTVGRFWIEALRIDTVNHIGGFRLNNYTSAIVFAGALAALIWLIRHRPGTDSPVEPVTPEDSETGTDRAVDSE